ncbi:hypothetical protein KFE25_014352 [Diacronema lutheri]|uniref:JmjC domain-containing protein n=2 Tax=Diacronema lutheri TaxID=2081491 RepID=A0A8J6C409_DIALT|nr:hypothetical protein KFE25_014352 [Diacronema lutheri]
MGEPARPDACPSSKRQRGASAEAEAARRVEAIRAFATRVEPRWLERSNVDRRSVDGLSHAEFVEKYEKPRVPLILTGAVSKWRAATEWTRARLVERYGQTRFRVSASIDMPLGEYLAYADSCGAPGAREERPLYLFDKDFCSKCPEMASEFAVPEYFAEDLMGVLGEQRRPDHRWLIIGPAGAGSSFHVDPSENFAWNATIVGRKKWVLYPPECPPPCSAEDERQLSLPRWFREHYDMDEHAGSRLECVTEAGECMFVPRGWWHCVLNLELCVAMTHNVVTRHNLLPLLDFLEQRACCAPGEGCRGRTRFDLSGDVPASVIYPFPHLVTVDAYAAGGAGGAVAADDEPCACAVERAALLTDLRAGLERERPGLIDNLLAERNARAAAASSVWSRLVGPHAGARHGAACDAAPGIFLADMLGGADESPLAK